VTGEVLHVDGGAHIGAHQTGRSGFRHPAFRPASPRGTRTGLAQTTVSPRRYSSAFKNFWGAFQEWRKWGQVRADLCNLNDRELMDIGITRAEIDYVASNRDTDARSIRSAARC
jgi:uncharacterized protein YjiS (DUF1127 family)